MRAAGGGRSSTQKGKLSSIVNVADLGRRSTCCRLASKEQNLRILEQRKSKIKKKRKKRKRKKRKRKRKKKRHQCIKKKREKREKRWKKN